MTRDAIHLVRELRDHKVDIWISARGDVRIDPPGRVPPDMLARAREQKNELTLLLRVEARLAEVGAAQILNDVAPAIALKRHLKCPDDRFQELCERLLGRPGPTTSEEDFLVVRALLGEAVGPLGRVHTAPPGFVSLTVRSPHPSPPWSRAIPANASSRAAHIGLCSRHAGLAPDELFDLVDSRFGYRTVGPFDLTADEANTIIAAIRRRFEEGRS